MNNLYPKGHKKVTSKIKWCCLQKDGIKLVERNENISKKYIEEADKDFIEMKNLAKKKQKRRG